MSAARYSGLFGSNSRLSTFRWIAVSGGWFLCVLLGFGFLLSHDTEIVDASSPDVQPDDVIGEQIIVDSDVVLRPPTGHLHLVMSIHPQCPCTGNSLRELERLLMLDLERTQCTFLVYSPVGAGSGWLESPTMQVANRIASGDCEIDIAGRRALQLGLDVSGAVLVVDERGQILFEGGITSGRSCTMENPGAAALRSILKREPVPFARTPVFGCSLKTPGVKS